MYTRYAERRGWKVELLDETPSDLGGVKSATVAVKAKGVPEPGEAPYALLKFEGGVHRVQRVPVTESQGRIHTSAAGVLVMPEAEQIDVTIDENDLRIDVFRSSGPGGQSVNTTDSAVRITHAADRHRRVVPEREEPAAEPRAGDARAAVAAAAAGAGRSATPRHADARRSQVRTVDRSERIRTYNFPENRITDHRVGYKAHNLDQVLDGDLQAVIDAWSTPTWPTGWRPSSRSVVSRRVGATTSPAAREATARLDAAGVPSPRHDAEVLLGQVLGISRGALLVGPRADARRRPGRDSTRSSSSGRPRAAPAHHRARRHSATSSSRSVPACSSRVPRPR